MLKENKGITLVALVITIIVLLILAGVSIAMIGGENGILTKASEAKDENVKGEVNTALAMAVNEALTRYYAGDDGYAFTDIDADMIADLAEDYSDYTFEASGDEIKVKDGENYLKDGETDISLTFSKVAKTATTEMSVSVEKWS